MQLLVMKSCQIEVNLNECFDETFNKIKLDINARILFLKELKLKKILIKKEVKFELSDFDNFYRYF